MKTKEDIKILMDQIFKELQTTREAGQKEYAHDTDNAFRNFESLSKFLSISREKVLWVYLQKHLDGIIAHINGYQSQREDVRGRIKDSMVYLVLLWGMVDDSQWNVNVVDEYADNRVRNQVPAIEELSSLGAAIEFVRRNGYDITLKDYSKNP